MHQSQSGSLHREKAAAFVERLRSSGRTWWSGRCGERSEFILAVDISANIDACGEVVVVPVSTLAAGHALLQEGPQSDGGILDIGIGDHMVYPLADVLMANGVPIIFASSESRTAIPCKCATIPHLGKPINMMLAIEKLFSAC